MRSQLFMVVVNSEKKYAAGSLTILIKNIAIAILYFARKHSNIVSGTEYEKKLGAEGPRDALYQLKSARGL